MADSGDISYQPATKRLNYQRAILKWPSEQSESSHCRKNARKENTMSSWEYSMTHQSIYSVYLVSSDVFLDPKLQIFLTGRKVKADLEVIAEI